MTEVTQAPPRTGPRINYPRFTTGFKAMYALHEAVDAGPVDALLLALVRTRVSQLNGCAYCLDMHTEAARASGETQQRLDVLAAWREAGLFTEPERAALALAEAATLLAGRGVPDAVLDQAEAQFGDQELSTLLFAVAEINAWNRLVVTGRTPVKSGDIDDGGRRRSRSVAPWPFAGRVAPAAHRAT